MKTQRILHLSCRVIKLNLKLLNRLRQGAKPSDLETAAAVEKDFDQLVVLSKRLLLAIRAKVNEERMNNGTTAAYKRTPNVH